jgi:signal transduction histidine kinase
LAFGEFSPAELATNIGCDVRDILDFRADHEDEIAETRAALAGKLAIETAGLWIAKKQNRLAEMQADAEDLRDCIEALRDESRLGGQQHRDIVKTRVTLLKAVADELSPRQTGVKPRAEETGNVVRYVIEDDDIEAMK